MTQLYSFEGAMLSLDEIEGIKKERETVMENVTEEKEVMAEVKATVPKVKKVVIKSKKK